MCELHPQKCGTCKHIWTAHKKLASCDSQDPDVQCPPSLCMFVGNPRKPVKGECDACREVRERQESEDEESDDEGAAAPAAAEQNKKDGGKAQMATG